MYAKIEFNWISSILHYSACYCNTIGSPNITCDIGGKCTCREGYAGDTCDICAPGYLDSGNCWTFSNIILTVFKIIILSLENGVKNEKSNYILLKNSFRF